MTDWLDADGYPTEAALQRVREWPAEDLHGLARWLVEVWWYGPRYVRLMADGSVELVTGGWSGNEDVIAAMRDNVVLWSLCWQRSERGGLHVFTPARIRSSST